MSPRPIGKNLAEKYDLTLIYSRDDHLPPGAPRPQPTKYWPKGNIEFLEKYRQWLLQGGISELDINIYHTVMAGHVFGLTLKPYHLLDPDTDLDCALEYVKAKGLSQSWIKNCRNSLIKFRRFLRLERGLGDVARAKPFDIAAHTQGLPAWLVGELERFQRIQQRNWRTANVEKNIHAFWNRYLHAWRFLCEERHVAQLSDLKRLHLLDYIDKRLNEGRSSKGINTDMRCLRSFLLFLQDEGYPVPQSLLRVPSLKEPDSLPRYLTDEQVCLLRDDFEARVINATRSNHRRLALLDRAIFHLLWQCGLRTGEVEQLLLEDLDLEGRKINIRDGKGRKDRTVYIADTAIQVLKEYLAVRGSGFGEHVFLYRNAPLSRCFIGCRIKAAGERAGVSVYPHRLRHTCATQLLNAGCRVTSIQKYLGHKKLNTTMIYARVLDSTLADDYFKAMERVEQRLELSLTSKEQERSNYEIVKVPSGIQLFDWIERLALPELPQQERLDVAEKLKQALSLSYVSQLSPPWAIVA
jgi:integrase/recombinase XerD